MPLICGKVAHRSAYFPISGCRNLGLLTIAMNRNAAVNPKAHGCYGRGNLSARLRRLILSHHRQRLPHTFNSQGFHWWKSCTSVSAYLIRLVRTIISDVFVAGFLLVDSLFITFLTIHPHPISCSYTGNLNTPSFGQLRSLSGLFFNGLFFKNMPPVGNIPPFFSHSLFSGRLALPWTWIQPDSLIDLDLDLNFRRMDLDFQSWTRGFVEAVP